MLASLVGTVGWGILLGAFVLWELGGAIFDYPRFGGVIGLFTRWRVGRYLLFGFWVWLAWHFFIRGWAFFLRTS